MPARVENQCILTAMNTWIAIWIPSQNVVDAWHQVIKYRLITPQPI